MDSISEKYGVDQAVTGSARSEPVVSVQIGPGARYLATSMPSRRFAELCGAVSWSWIYPTAY
jgi:hypothetical protein